ncbi:hypothetical protein SKAU_G00401540 [Synaphobranchus kaupii]|uniref:Uncharacterized protein n=1 Tax=Synaphobranchus kaupii TaxID=118154 RepID=A0A9Q1IBL6_SYNKA|nr:hypothetical protein SKAU_G00401540 [Synaphobranchus kaupii]
MYQRLLSWLSSGGVRLVSAKETRHAVAFCNAVKLSTSPVYFSQWPTSSDGGRWQEASQQPRSVAVRRHHHDDGAAPSR